MMRSLTLTTFAGKGSARKSCTKYPGVVRLLLPVVIAAGGWWGLFALAALIGAA